MRAWNVTFKFENKPGELARYTKVFADNEINIEGYWCSYYENHCWAQFLVTDRSRVEGAFEKAGYKPHSWTEVLVESIPNHPGALHEYTQHFANEGINLTISYLATDTRVVWGCDDITALERAYRTVPAVSH